MKITIDKNLPVSVSVQIEGAIEFGVMAGVFRDNNRLPTVRALSAQLGVAPMTVTKAYKSLQNKGVLESITGRGTYVVRDPMELEHQNQVEELREEFLALLDKAKNLNIDPTLFITLLNQRNAENAPVIPLRILMVGNSKRINKSYIEVIKNFLGPDPLFDNLDFQDFETLEEKTALAYNLILTIPHCMARIRARVGDKVPVLAPYLIPSKETLENLADLPKGTVVGAISHFASFVPAMVEGIREFAPQIGTIHMALSSSSKLQEMVDKSDVLIYSTSSLGVAQSLCRVTHMFEYAHTPETRYLKEILLPAVQRIQKEVAV
ncbi:MAG: GntR family transcriptional regulator [Desulfobacterales bacterium]|nr:GntR family transcriptional regulator [Desulfobacterales bacterium]